MIRLPSTIVVDSSVALKWWLVEPESSIARRLIENRELCAPELLMVECANVFWKRIRRQEITVEEAARMMAMLRKAPVAWTSDADLVAEAQDLSVVLDHPVYDCLYLALALRLDAPLVTADRRLAALADRPELPAGKLYSLRTLA